MRSRVASQIVLCVGAVGKVQSLSRLTDELDLNYSHAYNMVRRLQDAGILHVERPGRDLVLTLGNTPEGGDIS